MTYVPYWQQLRDPRWQKKRLEIMSRDNWRCVLCRNASDTLNVHHGYYEKGQMPWEYPDASLHTLCEKCHALTDNYAGRTRVKDRGDA